MISETLMNRISTRIAAVLLAILAAVATSFAQQPRLTNGNLQPASASGGLEASLRQIAGTGAGPVWIGYAVPLTDNSKPRMICCGNSSSGENNTSCCGGCSLETDDYSNRNSQ